jgi:hypothetical protein
METDLWMQEYIQRCRGHYEFSDSTNGKIQNGKPSLTPNGNDSDDPPVIHDGLERLAADKDVNLGIVTPKVDYRIVYQLTYATATFCVQNSLVCYDSCLYSIYEGMPCVV